MEYRSESDLNMSSWVGVGLADRDGFLPGYCSFAGVCGLNRIFVTWWFWEGWHWVMRSGRWMWGGKRLADASQKRKRRDNVEYIL